MLGGVLAVDRLLEAAEPGSERPSHLGEALGPEHEQQDDQQKRDVNRVVKSHQEGSNRLRSIQGVRTRARIGSLNRARAVPSARGRDDHRRTRGHAAPAGGLLRHQDVADVAQRAGDADVGRSSGGHAEQRAGRRGRAAAPLEPHLVDPARGRRRQLVNDQVGATAVDAQLGRTR